MKYSYDEKCLDLARHFYPNQSKAFLDTLAQEFQDCVEGREDAEMLPIPDFLRNQENLRAERAEKETHPVPPDDDCACISCDIKRKTSPRTGASP